VLASRRKALLGARLVSDRFHFTKFINVTRSLRRKRFIINHKIDWKIIIAETADYLPVSSLDMAVDVTGLDSETN
jgi:hypothetical protein